MGKELPTPEKSEEVDLGQLFKLIGNAFERLFKLIGRMLHKVFLAFVWFVFFIKRHFIKFIVAGALGIVLAIILQKTSDPVYKSYITIKQNYNTGLYLYNSITYYNDLVKEKDYRTLENVLGIDSIQSKTILEFDIVSVINQNDLLKEYNTYVKSLDTTVAKNVTFEIFLEKDVDIVHKYQRIIIKAKQRNNFKIIFHNIIENIETSEYFQRERNKDIVELTNRKEALRQALIESDSLQTTYKKVLVKNMETKGSEIGITFEGNSNKEKTKEYELYLKNLDIRSELVDIERQISDKEQIIEVISNKQEKGVIDDKKILFGKPVGLKLYYGLFFITIAFLILISLDFNKFLENYKNKF